MPIDEVLMRDSCGKSRSKIKKYFYYNEYDSDNFPYISDFEELTLLDLIEGNKSFSDVIPLFIPSFILIIVGIGCIGVWISICVCSVKPKCFCKKDNKNTNRTRFICLMVFSGFALSIIVLSIVLIVYIANAEYDFNGTICSLLMFQYQIINGQGLLIKKPMYKPYWYGSNGINEAVTNINTFLQELKTTCEDNINSFNSATTDAVTAGYTLTSYLELIYEANKNEKIEATGPKGEDVETIPIYINNLGPITTNESYTGKVIEDYEKYFEYIIYDILGPVTGLCTVLSGDGGQYLTNGLGGFESVIENLNTMLDNLSSKITEYITDYSSLIVNLGYKFNLALFIIVIIIIIIQVILYIMYYFHPFTLTKYALYVFIHILNFILILCFIYNGIFSILAMVMGNMADIVDAVLSKENLSSQTPRLIDADGDLNKLTRCLRGDGDLFEEFVTEDVKTIVDPLTQLYGLYTHVKEVNSRINNETGKNEYNSLIALDNFIEELEEMKEDFVLTTTKEISSNYDISTMLDELNKYTMAGRRYQQQCITATYDIWTTNEEHCTNVQADINIVTGQCKYLKNYDKDPPDTTGAEAARDLYKSACSLLNTNDFPDVKTAVYNYILFFSKYRKANQDLIDKILENQPNPSDSEHPILGFNSLKSDFKTNFIDKVKKVMPIIDEKITGKVHTLFSNLLNDTVQDTRKLSEDFNLFSWMNCTSIGQDYNATLSTLKSNLTGEMRVITYCSLVCEILIIAVLYIMLGLNKNLRDKIFEINDERNVSHSSDNVEEIEIDSDTNRKSSEKNSDEVYAVKNKKNFQVVKDIDKRKGINVKSKSNLDEEGKGIEHPVMVSINGPSGKPLFANGENGEMAHNQMNKSKSYYKNNKETEEELTSSEGEKKYKSKSKSKSKGKTTTNGENEEGEKEEDGEEGEEEEDGTTNKKSKSKSKNTKSKGKVSSDNKKTGNTNDKKKETSEGSDTVSFG